MKLFKTISIKSLRWDFFKGSGKGGQKRNKTENCARCTHESGAQAQSEDSRSKSLNKSKALSRMIDTQEFKAWIEDELCNQFGMKRNYKIITNDTSIEIYDLGPIKEVKRKKQKRKPVMKDQIKDDRRKMKKSLKKFLS